MMRYIIIFCFASIVMTSCKESAQPTTPPPVVYKKDTSEVKHNEVISKKAPVINIVDTLQKSGVVLVVKDSSATGEGIGLKMNEIYSEILPKFIEEKKLSIIGPRMAWYKSSSTPFFFEAGFMVDKKPTGKLPKNMRVIEIKRDSAFVAHYFGPYDNTYHAYEAVKEWMKDHKKKSTAPPYEVYIGSMYDEKGQPIDPYKVQTDIVFPH